MSESRNTVTEDDFEWLAPLAVLPRWLCAAADIAIVGPALAHVSSERSGLPGADATFVRCTSARVRLAQRSWHVRYEIVVRDADGSDRNVALAGDVTRRPADAHSASGSSSGSAGAPATGSTFPLPSLGLDLAVEAASDHALPLLETLLDPQRAARLIERAVNEDAPASRRIRITRCEPHATRYKRGSRCTVVYDVDASWSDRRAAPPIVVVKTYRGDKGKVAYDGMRALWSSPLATSPVVRIAEPLGYLDHERLLVQGPVCESTTIKAIVRQVAAVDTAEGWEGLAGLLERAADGLAELHGSGADAGNTPQHTRPMVRRDNHLTALASAAPGPAGAAAHAFDLVFGWAARSSPDPDVPSHGSFRPAQVLVCGDEISFIDFDGFGPAEPAMDVALFCASLKMAGMEAAVAAARSGAERAACMVRLQSAADRFVDRYASHRAVDRERVAQREAVDLLTQLVNGWTKVSQLRLDAAIPLVVAHLRRWLP